jgi:cyclophilin family peptidyl-prolyl cis-trans isomerase/HEAT repeat protein
MLLLRDLRLVNFGLGSLARREIVIYISTEMKKIIFAFWIIISFLSLKFPAQVPLMTLVEIVKAEDELRFDETLANLLKSPNAKIRARAALASGRIGREEALPALMNLLENDRIAEVRNFAAFAIGEIESIKGAEAILKVLANSKDSARARALEAAGKIAAANPKQEKSKELSEAILQTLEAERSRSSIADKEIILLGLTAVLRARPEGSERVAANFLLHADARIRADAANTLARIRAKNANEILRKLLSNDVSPIVRANAARALGAAEDKEAIDLLLKAAINDRDSRVRVSAIRALALLKEKNTAAKLLDHGEMLLEKFKRSQKPNYTPKEKNEILEVATALGRILADSGDERAISFLNRFRKLDRFVSPETEIAFARIAPKTYLKSLAPEKFFGENWRTSAAAFQAFAEIGNLEPTDENNRIKSEAKVLLIRLIGAWVNSSDEEKLANNAQMSVPFLIRAFAAFKSENTSNILRPLLEIEKDVFIRATIAEILADQPATKENIEALKTAFANSLITDLLYNDAQLAILAAIVKLDKTEALSGLNLALDAPDFLVRRQAEQLIRQNDLTKYFPNAESRVGTVKAYEPKSRTKLGQVLNTKTDYIRAVSRKNASVKAVLVTEKGTFTIEFFPEDAPLTVDNFIKLAKSNYFDGLEVHRVVPNFVVQDGDSLGNGSGGPGWSIRCEINLIPYERGVVGMALSGKDTGGSQWFVTHSPQPHLDGGYTVFGHVSEKDMKIVDSIVRGDKILKVRIVEKTIRP